MSNARPPPWPPPSHRHRPPSAKALVAESRRARRVTRGCTRHWGCRVQGMGEGQGGIRGGDRDTPPRAPHDTGARPGARTRTGWPPLPSIGPGAPVAYSGKPEVPAMASRSPPHPGWRGAAGTRWQPAVSASTKEPPTRGRRAGAGIGVRRPEPRIRPCGTLAYPGKPEV